MTLFAFSASLSCNISPKAEGMICHDRPYLSFSQPHLCFSPPFRKLLPKLVYFLLRLTVHKERDSRREGEVRATVECHKLLPFELECPGHYRPLRSWPSFSISTNAHNL